MELNLNNTNVVSLFNKKVWPQWYTEYIEDVNKYFYDKSFLECFHTFVDCALALAQLSPTTAQGLLTGEIISLSFVDPKQAISEITTIMLKDNIVFFHSKIRFYVYKGFPEINRVYLEFFEKLARKRITPFWLYLLGPFGKLLELDLAEGRQIFLSMKRIDLLLGILEQKKG
jgi:hypothetical protein